MGTSIQVGVTIKSAHGSWGVGDQLVLKQVNVKIRRYLKISLSFKASLEDDENYVGPTETVAL